MSGREAGQLSFDRFYETMHGSRWPKLRQSLVQDPVYTCLTDGFEQPYYLDPASVVAAQALDVQADDRVLDMCAAPGGKSLVLASLLTGNGTMVCNDRSSKRRARLHRVLEDHLPEELYRRIQITGHDASKWCLYEQDAYDKILLDVPCSSERHVLSSEKHLSRWSPARTKHLAMQSYAMLAGAIRVVKPGGHIVYCTCTISNRENDEVIAKLLKKRGDGIEFIPFRDGPGEPTEFGWQIWPDRSDGAGPIYFCTVRRL